MKDKLNLLIKERENEMHYKRMMTESKYLTYLQKVFCLFAVLIVSVLLSTRYYQGMVVFISAIASLSLITAYIKMRKDKL